MINTHRWPLGPTLRGPYEVEFGPIELTKTEEFEALKQAFGKANATEYHGYAPGTLAVSGITLTTCYQLRMLGVVWIATIVPAGSIAETADFHAFPQIH